MFLDHKTQYYENDHTTNGNLQIQCNPYQITNGSFHTELELKFLQYVQKDNRPQIAKAILKKKNGARGINLADFRLYYKATVIKTVWSWHKNRHTGSMEQDKKPRDKPLHLWAPYL